jgi:hypothetical protein
VPRDAAMVATGLGRLSGDGQHNLELLIIAAGCSSARQHRSQVGERAVVFADEVEHDGALVPPSAQSGERATMSSRMGMAIAGTLYLAVVPFRD